MIVQEMSKNYKQYFPKNQTSENILKDAKSFQDYLKQKIRGIIDVNAENDGLIFYYSGHGEKDVIILGNDEKCAIKQNIMNIFSGEECIHLRGKPKIAIFDCCRGKDISQTYQVEEKDDEKENTHMKLRGNWYDSMSHSHADMAIIFSNFEGFVVNDSDYGGCLTRAIEKVFEKPELIQSLSLHDLIFDIRKQTKINAGTGNKDYKWSPQTVDFHETLDSKVYFGKNS